MKQRFRRGVTLLEMLIVLAIIGIMSSVVWPAATTALESLKLRSAADSTATLLAQAAVQVERRQQPVEIVIDRESGKLTVAGVNPSVRRELVLEHGISISRLETQFMTDSGPGEESGGPRRIVLMPGAGWPVLRIELENSRHVRRVVSLDPITGAPSVRTPVEGAGR